MRIVLTHEKKLYVLDEPIPEAPPAGASAAIRNAHTRHANDSVEVLTMSFDLKEVLTIFPF